MVEFICALPKFIQFITEFNLLCFHLISTLKVPFVVVVVVVFEKSK